MVGHGWLVLGVSLLSGCFRLDLNFLQASSYYGTEVSLYGRSD
jgi:hypothetical protein